MLRRILSLLVALLAALPLQVLAQSLTVQQPNDPGYDRQWHLQKIAAICAWEHTIGSQDVIVAVVDTGVDLSHPDLAPNILSSGFDFVDGDDDASDENGHGTNVAGIIAAVTHNGEGVSGIAGGVRILPVRVLDAEGAGTSEDIADGIRYAVDQGARVINLSLGSILPVENEIVVEAIRDAHRRGALVVVAAGNSYLPIPNFALGLEEDALIVAATDQQDRKTDFSNYGPWVGVSAPGDRIYSTMPTYEVFLTSNALPPDQRFQRNYDFMSGTSQATPVVSAIAALLFSAHPDWDADRVRQEIQRTATNIRANNPRGIVFRPEYLGSGRVNACDALGGPLNPSSASAAPRAVGKSALIILVIALLGLVLLLAAAALFLRRRRRQPVIQPAGAHLASFGPSLPPSTPSGVPPFGPTFTPGAPYQPAAPPFGSGLPGTPPAVAQPVPSPAAPAPGIQPSPAAPTAQPLPSGRLLIVQGPGQGRAFNLNVPSLLLGRSAECTIVLSDDLSVSRQHARFTFHGYQLVVEDLGSSYGTYVNGQRITQPTPLRPGDTIHAGQTTLVYEV